MAVKKKVVKHLKKDIKGYKKEIKEDKALIKDVKKSDKVSKVMKEFKDKKLHMGSKKGKLVKNKKQAIAIGLSEAKRAAKKKK